MFARLVRLERCRRRRCRRRCRKSSIDIPDWTKIQLRDSELEALYETGAAASRFANTEQ